MYTCNGGEDFFVCFADRSAWARVDPAAYARPRHYQSGGIRTYEFGTRFLRSQRLAGNYASGTGANGTGSSLSDTHEVPTVFLGMPPNNFKKIAASGQL